MPDTTDISPLHWMNIFRPLGEGMSSQLAAALRDLRVGEEAQRRYDELASKNTEGTLTGEERSELEEFVVLNRMVSLLKAEAMLALKSRAA